MASDDGRKNNGQSRPESNAENPFVQFRQFADSQISSLLQGIIGLPSAFSRNPSSNVRWADFDDDLRRRDDLQARQKELRDSEARKGHTANEQVSRVDSGNCFSFGSYGLKPQEALDGETKDLPLFSPVTKDLFMHLPGIYNEHGDWRTTGSARWGTEYLEKYLEKDADYRVSAAPNASPMKLTQYLMCDNLKRSHQFHSDYSAMPYLLFSPYSPLRLREEAKNAVQEDNFPYLVAFEDLLQISRNRGPREIIDRQKYYEGDVGNPVGYMAWLCKLDSYGIISQSEERRTTRNPWQGDQEGNTSNSAFDQGTPSSAENELDMYKHFLQWASTPGAIFDAVKAADTFLSAVEKTTSKESDGQDQAHDNSSIPRIIQELLAATKSSSEVPDFYKKEGLKVLSGWNVQPADEKSQAKTRSQDSEKIVSSSTTTERTTHEDGTVETSVTVWKKFGNGREITTTTHHCEDPALEEDGNMSVESPEKKHAEKPREQKGWFWN